MGTTASSPSPLQPTFERMGSWDIKAARRLLQDYKDKDLDFALDAQVLGDLVNDKEWAESIIDAFGSTNGIVNALAFITGASLVSTGPALEKASLVFDSMDFDSTEEISMDEMTISLLCACRGLCVMAGVGSVPSDESLESITLQAYRDFSKSSAQSITKSEFTDWIIKFASGCRQTDGGPMREVTLQAAMEQFGVIGASDASVAGENNHQTAQDNETMNMDQEINSSPIEDTHEFEETDNYGYEAEQTEVSDLHQHHSIEEEVAGDNYDEDLYETSNGQSVVVVDDDEQNPAVANPEVGASDVNDTEEQLYETEENAYNLDDPITISDPPLDPIDSAPAALGVEDSTAVDSLPVKISAYENEEFAQNDPSIVDADTEYDALDNYESELVQEETAEEPQHVGGLDLEKEEAESYDDGFDGEGEMSARYDDDTYDGEQREESDDVFDAAEHPRENSIETFEMGESSATSQLPFATPAIQETPIEDPVQNEEPPQSIESAQDEVASAHEDKISSEGIFVSAAGNTSEDVLPIEEPITSDDYVNDDARSREEPGLVDETKLKEESGLSESPATNEILAPSEEASINENAVLDDPTTSEELEASEDTLSNQGPVAIEESSADEQTAGSQPPTARGNVVLNDDNLPSDDAVASGVLVMTDEASPAEEDKNLRYEENEEEKGAEQQNLLTEDRFDEVAAPDNSTKEIDVNAFDTYDYEDTEFDASSGLPPPEPTPEELYGEESPTEPNEQALSPDEDNGSLE